MSDKDEEDTDQMTPEEFQEYLVRKNAEREDEWEKVPDVYQGKVYFYDVSEKQNYGYEGCLITTQPEESDEETEVILQGIFEGTITGAIAKYLNRDGSIGYGRGE